MWGISKKFKFLHFPIFLLLFLLANIGHGQELKVALVLDKGGRDDKSFNASAFSGSERAKKDFGVQVKVVEVMDDAATESVIRSFAQKNFDLVVAIGFSMTDGVKKVAKQFPKVKFVLVDGEAVGENIRSVLFEEHQGSFLVGAAAALESKTGKVGFLGGMEVPLIKRFYLGYEAGAKHVNPKVQVIQSYMGVTSDAWNNPAKAKELTLSQIAKGADVIFGAAGASNYGMFEAVKEKKVYAIGVDSNQNWVKPGFVLTSMLKRVDNAVFSTVSDLKNNKFTAGTRRYGLSDGGVDYSYDEFNKTILTAGSRKKLDELKAGIISGKIQVPDYYKNAKK